MTGVSIKRRNLDIAMHMEKCHMSKKIEIGVICLQAEETIDCQQTTRELGEKCGTDTSIGL